MSKSWSHAVLFASLAGVLAGCSTVPEQPVRAPMNSVSNANLSSDEPIPRVESPSRSGNPDTYVVFGRRYRVKETSAGHRETGVASWYGWDFHGRKTSSGPAFNMFDLTAAHKSLPIPTYVRVTHLENGRSIVVKVNDRGPFSGERILDLSYAAAARLDMLNQGTAKVEVVALQPYQFLPKLAAKRAQERERVANRAAELISRRAKAVAARSKPTPKAAPKPTDRRVAAADKNSTLYVVGTVTERNSARQVQNRLSSQMQRTVQVDSGTGKRYEVRVPVRNSGEAKRVAMQLASLGVSGSRVIAY